MSNLKTKIDSGVVSKTQAFHIVKKLGLGTRQQSVLTANIKAADAKKKEKVADSSVLKANIKAADAKKKEKVAEQGQKAAESENEQLEKEVSTLKQKLHTVEDATTKTETQASEDSMSNTDAASEESASKTNAKSKKQDTGSATTNENEKPTEKSTEKQTEESETPKKYVESTDGADTNAVPSTQKTVDNDASKDTQSPSESSASQESTPDDAKGSGSTETNSPSHGEISGAIDDYKKSKARVLAMRAEIMTLRARKAAQLKSNIKERMKPSASSSLGESAILASQETDLGESANAVVSTTAQSLDEQIRNSQRLLHALEYRVRRAKETLRHLGGDVPVG